MADTPIYNNNVGALAKLFLASSLFRLVMGLAAVLVFCTVRREDVDSIRWFAIIFIVFFIVTLVFDAIFFAKVSKKQ